MPNNLKPSHLSEIESLAHGRIETLLHALPETARAALSSAARITQIDSGTCILAEGDHANALSYLLDGALAMEKTLADGRRHIIGVLVPTDMFGRLFDGGSVYDIVALTECRILSFERSYFEAILTEFPELERIFLVSVLDELDSAREWVLLMSARKVSERLASFLLILLRRNLRTTLPKEQCQKHTIVRIPIRRRDLAHHLGTTTETISRVLTEWERDGVILRKEANEIEVLDPAALVRISGAEDLDTTDPGQPLAK
ncbi:Crp/Fnr family transcriptional regulator [uncultured Thioclava sp.]|uniref:Crp/Fnr family transcriptional regulator n=1 Tax=Thioclava arctica TaxID=3238301 RepID=A0ABV3TJM4_9RHOB|nr:Crp/Fnr family transcriptional regulator [uncultured Thioclava sp.]